MQGGYLYGTSSGNWKFPSAERQRGLVDQVPPQREDRVPQSTRTEDKRIATRILGKRLAEISTNTFVGPTHERITVGELADDLFRDYRINGRKTTDDVQTRWRLHIEPFFGSRRVMEITSDLVAKYVDHRQSEHAL